MPTFDELFLEYGGIAFDRQLHLTDQIGDWAWRMDAKKGSITFSKGQKRLSVPMQILGTEVKSSSSWVWGWVEEVTPIPPPLFRVARELRARAQRDKLVEFATVQLPLARYDGHRLSMIASAMLDAPGYYRGPFDGGALFVLLEDPKLKRKEDHPLQRVAAVFPKFLAGFPVIDHRKALDAHLRAYGITLRREANRMEASDRSGDRLVAEFDGQGRLTNLTARMTN